MNLKDLEQLFPSAITPEILNITMGDNAQVAVFKLLPEHASKSSCQILFIPGFAGYTGQWSEIINTLLQLEFSVYIFETREKSSSNSKVTDPRFNTDGLIADLVDVLRYLKMPQPFCLLGNSLGTTIILKHVIDNGEEQEIIPEKIVLFEAVYESTPLAKLIKLAKRPILFRTGMRVARFFAPLTKRKLKKTSPVTYEKSIRRLKEMDAEKMRVGLLSSVEMEIKDDLPKVGMPALILGTAIDEIHPKEQAMFIAESIANARYVSRADDEEMHSADSAKIIAEFLNE
ncbi:MAG: alpha/beta fold hydrolase [Candidatus Heimdallarchaeota archaeon]